MTSIAARLTEQAAHRWLNRITNGGGAVVPIRFVGPGEFSQCQIDEMNAHSRERLTCYHEHTQLALYGSVFCYRCGWLDAQTWDPYQ